MFKRLVWLTAVVMIVGSALCARAQQKAPWNDGEIERFDTIRQRVERTIATYRTIPDSADIHRAFGGKVLATKFVTTSTGAASTMVVSRDDPTNALTRGIEVVIFSPEQIAHPKINGKMLFYDEEWRAVFMIDAPFRDPAWADAFLMSALFRAAQHKRSVPIPSSMPQAVRELYGEVAAHDLQRAVLSAATNGTYGREVRRIAGTLARDANGQLAPPTEADYETLNRLFVPATGDPERMFRLAQETYDIIAIWIEANFPKEAWQRQKAGLYLALANYRHPAGT